MTLQQWCLEANVTYSTTLRESIRVYVTKEFYAELFHLSDHKVSSITAGSIYLVPVKEGK